MTTHILDFLKKANSDVKRKFGFTVNQWEIPPERNEKGLLSAYSEIYSLFARE